MKYKKCKIEAPCWPAGVLYNKPISFSGRVSSEATEPMSFCFAVYFVFLAV